ncbi:CvpA family protein [Marinicella sp. S1101]|uniref:CvpA family protein n=1 Tax=Marinicella marina TaxID=2996016 RepID=UPI002260E097|nr:CvpA family protein [Marinicella marina]MCX7553778.1 CvpA family protein [Marinicella marina]MDJ1140853.1 CvpA family protein [Marinicella marina]
MNWFDLTIIAILGLSVIVSLFRGLIREVMSLLIWVGAFWLAWTFVDRGAGWLEAFIELPSARHLISFVALFLAALIVGGIINYLVGKMITKTGLGATDRFFGMFFGLGRGIIAVTALVLFIQATPFSKDPWWTESKLTPQFAKLADWVKEQMPEDMGEYFSFMQPEQLKETLNPALKELNNQQPTTTEGEQPADDALEESQPETDTEI